MGDILLHPCSFSALTCASYLQKVDGVGGGGSEREKTVLVSGRAEGTRHDELGPRRIGPSTNSSRDKGSGQRSRVKSSPDPARKFLEPEPGSQTSRARARARLATPLLPLPQRTSPLPPARPGGASRRRRAPPRRRVAPGGRRPRPPRATQSRRGAATFFFWGGGVHCQFRPLTHQTQKSRY